MEVLFDPLVLPLGYTIGLGVECGRQVLVDSQFLSEGLSEVRGEPWVSVADDFCRESKPLVHMIHV